METTISEKAYRAQCQDLYDKITAVLYEYDIPWEYTNMVLTQLNCDLRIQEGKKSTKEIVAMMRAARTTPYPT